MTPQERKNLEWIRDNVHSKPMTQVEAMKLALEALEETKPHFTKHRKLEAITALRQAIEQSQKQDDYQRGYADAMNWKVQNHLEHLPVAHKQEPVAWRFQSAVGGWAYGKEPPIGSKYAVEPLYTSPPQRQSVGLKQDDVIRLATQARLPFDYETQEPVWLDRLETFAKLVAELIRNEHD